MPRLHYEYTEQLEAGVNEFSLPGYFEALCDPDDVRVYCAPTSSFAQAFGKVAGSKLTVTASCAAEFNIWVTATRNDVVSQQDLADFGVEYPER